MVTKLRDVIAAEEALESAEAEYRRLTTDRAQWSAFESVDKAGKRTLNVMPSQFERMEASSRRVAAAHELVAAKRGFLQGVLPDATS